MNNFQREGSISNSHVGREFENKIMQYFHDKGVNLDFDVSVPIGIKLKKNKKFDLGSTSLGILIECKAHTWTKPNYNSPSAKLTTWISEMYKFQLTPGGFRKIFVVQYDYSTRHNETLLQYFIRLNRHLIPGDVELMEFDVENGIMYKRSHENNDYTVTNKTFKDLLIYLELQQKVNRFILELYSVDILNVKAFPSFYKNLDNISSSINKIFEIKIVEEKYEVNHKNGILLLNDIMEIHNFRAGFSSIVESHGKLLYALKVYRNKINHQPHNLDVFSLGSVNEDFELSFRFKDSDFKIYGAEIVNVVIKLNTIMSSIIMGIKAEKLADIQKEYIDKYNYLKFNSKTYKKMNEILDSDFKLFYKYLMDCKLEE